jgi:predicted nucleic acid-binding protein
VAGRTPERGLVDTSVAIALETLDPAGLPTEIAISALSLAELSAGPAAAKSVALQARRQDRLQRIEASIEALEFDARCARAYGPIYAATSALGRKARAVDLMIAATARAHRLPLYKLDAGDLRGLDELVEIVAVGQ